MSSLIQPVQALLSLTSSVNTKIHCVPPHSNLHGRRLNTLSTTTERPNTEATFSISLSNEPLPPSAANVLRTSWDRKVTQNLSQPALCRHPHIHCYLGCASWFSSVTLLLELSVLITPLHSFIRKSPTSQSKPIFERDGLARSQIFLPITSAPQSASHQSKQTAVRRGSCATTRRSRFQRARRRLLSAP